MNHRNPNRLSYNSVLDTILNPNTTPTQQHPLKLFLHIQICILQLIKINLSRLHIAFWSIGIVQAIVLVCIVEIFVGVG